MAKSLMLLLALVALCVPAAAEEAESLRRAGGAQGRLDPCRASRGRARCRQALRARLLHRPVARGQHPRRRRGAQRQAGDGAILRRRGRALGRQARPRDLRPRGQARPALDLQERHFPARRHRAERRQIPRARLPGVRRLSRLCRSAHAGEGAHHLPRSLDHVVGPGLGREPAVERSAQQRSGDDPGGRSVPLHPLPAGRLAAGHGLRLFGRRHVAAGRNAGANPPGRACATMRATSCSRRSISPTSNGSTPASAASSAPSAACDFGRATPPSSAACC